VRKWENQRGQWKASKKVEGREGGTYVRGAEKQRSMQIGRRRRRKRGKDRT
jgi:hypothetical protein